MWSNKTASSLIQREKKTPGSEEGCDDLGVLAGARQDTNKGLTAGLLWMIPGKQISRFVKRMRASSSPKGIYVVPSKMTKKSFGVGRR